MRPKILEKEEKASFPEIKRLEMALIALVNGPSRAEMTFDIVSGPSQAELNTFTKQIPQQTYLFSWNSLDGIPVGL